MFLPQYSDKLYLGRKKLSKLSGFENYFALLFNTSKTLLSSTHNELGS